MPSNSLVLAGDFQHLRQFEVTLRGLALAAWSCPRPYVQLVEPLIERHSLALLIFFRLVDLLRPPHLPTSFVVLSLSSRQLLCVELPLQSAEPSPASPGVLLLPWVEILIPEGHVPNWTVEEQHFLNNHELHPHPSTP
jgi:hypothetical protein